MAHTQTYPYTSDIVTFSIRVMSLCQGRPLSQPVRLEIAVESTEGRHHLTVKGPVTSLELETMPFRSFPAAWD